MKARVKLNRAFTARGPSRLGHKSCNKQTTYPSMKKETKKVICFNPLLAVKIKNKTTQRCTPPLSPQAAHLRAGSPKHAPRASPTAAPQQAAPAITPSATANSEQPHAPTGTPPRARGPTPAGRVPDTCPASAHVAPRQWLPDLSPRPDHPRILRVGSGPAWQPHGRSFVGRSPRAKSAIRRGG